MVLQTLHGLHRVLVVDEVHEALDLVGIIALDTDGHRSDLSVRLEQLLEIILRPRLGEARHVAAHPFGRVIRVVLLVLHDVDVSLVHDILVHVLQNLLSDGGVRKVHVTVVKRLAVHLVVGDLARKNVSVSGELVQQSLVVHVVRQVLHKQITLDVGRRLELGLLEHHSHLLSLQHREVRVRKSTISYPSLPLPTNTLLGSTEVDESIATGLLGFLDHHLVHTKRTLSITT